MQPKSTSLEYGSYIKSYDLIPWMLLSIAIMPFLSSTEVVVPVGNYTLVPINICIESKHSTWLVCFSWADNSGEFMLSYVISVSAEYH